MGQFSFGSYTRMLVSCCQKAVTNKLLCGTLLLVFNEEGAIYDIRTSDDTVGKLLSGGQNLPSDLIDRARRTDIKRIQNYFEKEIVHRLDENKRQHIVLGLRELIEKDQSINNNTQLGTSKSMTKAEFIATNTVAFTELLADLFLYVVVKTDNTTHKAEMKQICRKYCDKFECRKDEITVYELPQIQPVSIIPNTIKGRKFDSVFKQIKMDKLSIKNPSDVQIYRLDIENNEFVYDSLDKFLLNNVGNYN